MKISIARAARPHRLHFHLTLALLLSASACMTTPLNGTTDSATSVIGHAMSFGGFDTTAGTPVSVQVLTDPETLDPLTSPSWVTIGTATTSTYPIYWNSTQPLYMWSLTATPVPSSTEAARWPQGGVMRVRAAAHNGLANIFDQDFGECFSQHSSESWDNLGTHCASSTGGVIGNGYATVAAIISTSPNPTDVVPSGTRAHFLSKKPCLVGQNPNEGPDAGHCTSGINASDTQNYYATIGAPGTLDCFKTMFGLGGNSSNCGFNMIGVNNDFAEAIYYNKGDLGLGRHMRCRSFVSQNFVSGNRLGVACAVGNYTAATQVGKFGVDPDGAITAAVTDKRASTDAHAFATVAMIYLTPQHAGDPNSVSFMVYDAQGQLTPEAKLDSTAFNTAVPTNCMVCHGGSSNFNPATSSVTSAYFLPFDPDSFLYSTSFPESDPVALVPSLRALNNLVLATNPPAAEQDFIRQMYGNNMVSGVPDPSYVAPGYRGSATAARVYKEVIKPYCRTCHLSSISYPFTDFTQLTPLAPSIKADVCDVKSMPQAEQTMKQMWDSPARAHLLGGLGLTTSCKP